MTTCHVGRTLSLFRRLANMTRDEIALALDCRRSHVRDLELGRAQLGYLEGLRFAKATGACPNCFRRHVEAAAERDGLSVGDDVPITGSSGQNHDLQAGSLA